MIETRPPDGAAVNLTPIKMRKRPISAGPRPCFCNPYPRVVLTMSCATLVGQHKHLVPLEQYA